MFSVHETALFINFVQLFLNEKTHNAHDRESYYILELTFTLKIIKNPYNKKMSMKFSTEVSKFLTSEPLTIVSMAIII